MTKYERAKLWVKKNQESIIAIGIGTALVGLFIFGVKSEMKYRSSVTAELNGYIDELNDALAEFKNLELVQ